MQQMKGGAASKRDVELAAAVIAGCSTCSSASEKKAACRPAFLPTVAHFFRQTLIETCDGLPKNPPF